MEINIWTVEYSKSENSYHISWLTKIVEANLMNIAKGIDKDYLLIGVFVSQKECYRFVQDHKSANMIDTFNVYQLVGNV